MRYILESVKNISHIYALKKVKLQIITNIRVNRPGF